ncbi:hypothetical protein KPATCC21470_8158 [Kitasatospora purpeofusca]
MNPATAAPARGRPPDTPSAPGAGRLRTIGGVLEKSLFDPGSPGRKSA